MVANNVLAHVPISSISLVLQILLKPEGSRHLSSRTFSIDPRQQFDTIYHEHFSYLSLGVVMNVLKGVGLRAFDAEELPTHGGSLRVFVCHDTASHPQMQALSNSLKRNALRAFRLIGICGLPSGCDIKCRASIS